ncbi:MAG: LytTR family DNA-binding domain-containing protein [Bacteroidales bacterium]|jgi:DNA-binding LytR/AlgR family response regulator|nr:LytTR family DNA-binding domain-containing protein [Bacteroidales bacterium]
MKYTCIAIDDEPFALKQMSDYIRKTPFLALNAACFSANEAMEILAENKVDILFVDINMPGLNGMDFVKSLSGKYQIVFTTAYSEYAVESYKVEAVDYLLKPITYADFLKSANKVKSKLEDTARESQKETTDHFFVKADGKHVRIAFEEICHIESLSEYVKIHLLNGEKVITYMRLKHLEAALPSSQFMRIHRSFIINLNKIKAVERARILMINEKYVSVGELYKPMFKQFLEENFL